MAEIIAQLKRALDAFHNQTLLAEDGWTLAYDDAKAKLAEAIERFQNEVFR